MAQVYDVHDDDVDLVDLPSASPSSSSSGDDNANEQQSSQGSSPPLRTPPNAHSNNSVKDEVMHVDVEEAVPATSSPPRSTSTAGAENMKMEEAGKETTEGEKQNESSLLPNPDNSALLLPPPPTALNPDSSSVHNNDALSSSTTSVDAKPPSLNGVVVATDDKSKKVVSTSVKPKSVKRRSPSPEPLPPQPQCVQTIRLDISLGGPENYAVDILQLSKDTGQRPPTPPPPLKRDTSESEGEGDDAAHGVAGIGKGKGRGKAGRKNAAAEYYDLNDPFIDDSELAMDERTYFAQTKQQGFYVSSGEVALMKDRTRDKESREPDGVTTSPAKKPKSKRNIIPTIIPLAGSLAVNAVVASSAPIPTATVTAPPPPPHPVTSPTGLSGSQSPGVQGTRETPITLSDTEDNRVSFSTIQGPDASVSVNGTSANGSSALKRKASEGTTSGKKKRKTVEIESFHPELQTALCELKDAISHASFDQKGKFPPALKPILARVALKAISVGEYNDSFFTLMPKLFIYNKYTMTKLIKRTVYADHQKLLLARQDELIEELAKLAQEGFEKAKEEYEKSVAAWERRQERSKAGTTSVEGTPAPGSSTPSMNGATLPPPGNDTGADSGMEVDGVPSATQAAGGDKDKTHSSQHMPIKRFRLTERMRNIIWELVVLSNESCRIENEKNTLENSTVQVSEQGTRKVLYQKIVAAFPDGWMSSGQISREVSVMKKRYEAQQAEGIS